METLFQIEITTKILRYLQYRIAQKISAEEDILTLLPSLDICLLEQFDTSTTPMYICH